MSLAATLAWLEHTAEVRVPTSVVVEDPDHRRLLDLELLALESSQTLDCTLCERQCARLPLRSDANALAVSPAGARLVVLCPEGEWEGGRVFDSTWPDAAYVLKRDAVLGALERANPGRRRVERPLPPGTTLLFTTRYAGHEADVVFAHGLGDNVVRTLRGLRQTSVFPLLVVSPNACLSFDQHRLLSAEGIAYVAVLDLLSHEPPSLKLPWPWPRLLPRVFADPEHEYWLCHDVELLFAEGPKGHLVHVNGEPSPYFLESDLAFARLLRLAGARHGASHVEDGGRLARKEIDPDPKHKGLDDLRHRLHASLPPHRQPSCEGRHLIRATRDGELYLALHPQSLRFDSSLQRLRRPAPGRASGSGGDARTRDNRKGSSRAQTLLQNALDSLPLEDLALKKIPNTTE